MDAAVDAGINDFDTAEVCGGPQAADMTKGTASPRRSLGGGYGAAGAATRSSRPRLCTSRGGSGRATGGCRGTTCGGRATFPWDSTVEVIGFHPYIQRASWARWRVRGTPPQYPAGKHTDTQL